MKKKVKKIPKFNSGGTAYDMLMKTPMPVTSPTFNPGITNVQSGATAGTIAAGKEWKDFNKTQKANAVSDAAGGVAALWDMASSEQDVSVGTAMNGMATGMQAGAAFGPVGMAVGAGLGLLAGTAGRGNKVDVNSSSEVTSDIARKGSGWLKPFGMSDEAMYRKANMVANANIATRQSENIKANYYNNHNVPGSINVLAAEGGIVPGEHYASRREVEVSADGRNAVRYPWDPDGKDTYHVYTNPDGSSAVGNMVFTEEGVKRPNGEKYSDAAEKIIKGTKEGSKLRQISLRKLANEMEEQKMNKDIKQIKNGIPAHEKGIYYVDGQRAEYRHGRWWWNEGGKKDAQGKMYFVPYTGKSTPSETEPIKHTSETQVGPLDPAYKQHVRYSSTNDVERKATVSKPSSSKKTTATSRVTTSTVPSPEDTVLRRPERVYDYEEPVKTATVPTDDTKVYGRDGRVAYDYTSPERKVTPEDLGRTTNNDNNVYTGSNWRDGLYRMAVLSQPLWDRAKAEPVDYTLPVYKYMPTQIDVSSQLRDADQSYALSRYNFANLYPNTGAGMAAGLQAASNRAKQYADVRQWQTNAQNELIGKNVGIYNNWANEYARILNDVYNKSAQNRAAARNINRQNRTAALNNFGTMLSDDKKMAMERMKFNILKPAIRSTYEDATANDLMDIYNSLFG